MSEYYEIIGRQVRLQGQERPSLLQDEVWVKPEADGCMTVGLTDFAQRRSGDVVFAEVSPTGTKVERGGLLGQLRDH